MIIHSVPIPIKLIFYKFIFWTPPPLNKTWLRHWTAVILKLQLYKYISPPSSSGLYRWYWYWFCYIMRSLATPSCQLGQYTVTSATAPKTLAAKIHSTIQLCHRTNRHWSAATVVALKWCGTCERVSIHILH